MNTPESLNFLSRKCLRGCLVFKLLWLASMVACGVLFFFSDTRPWVGTMFMLCIAFGLGLKHVRDRYNLLKRLSDGEETVYWVQQHQAEDALTKKVLAGKKCLKLHMSSGQVLDVEIEKNDMKQLQDWLERPDDKPFWGMTYRK